MGSQNLNVGRSLFEVLETRELLAPTIGSLQVLPSTVNQGGSITLRAQATAPEGIRAVTFFRDLNGDSRWTPGVDVDLGATSTQLILNRYELTVVTNGSWPRTSNICADAIGNSGQWTASGPTSAVASVNARPIVDALSAQAGPIEAGGRMTLVGHVTDDTAGALVSVYLDRNSNGTIDIGFDTFIAGGFGTAGDGTFSAPIDIGLNWPSLSTIMVRAQDINGALSLAPRLLVIAVNNDPAPFFLGGATNRVSLIRDFNPDSATVSYHFADASGIRAVTIFLDLDDNGSWTPNVDISAKTVYWQGATDAEYLFETFYSDLAGRKSVRAYADAVDMAGHWRGACLLGEIVQQPLPQITSIYVEETQPQVFRATVDATIPPRFGEARADVTQIMLFIDRNSNAAFDVTEDIDLQDHTNYTLTSTGECRFVIEANLQSENWDRVGVFAAVVTADPPGTARAVFRPLSEVRQAPVRLSVGGVPRIISITTQVGINPANGASGVALPGTAVQITANWTAILGGRAVTFFYDSNSNGLWDPALDIDLGVRFVQGASGTVTFTSSALPSLPKGYGSIAAAVQDVSNRGVDSWGPPRTDTLHQIHGAPGVQFNGTPPSTAALNSTVTFSARLTDNFGVRAGTAFLDVNNNGFDGADRNVTTFNRISGTATNGIWQFSMNLSGIAAGTYTIYVAAVDFYQGHSSQPGGVTNGLWSPRIAFSITIA